MSDFQSREDKIYKIEVHVAPICLKDIEASKVLIAKRTKTRALFPGLWECGGGQVHTRENFEDALKRQVQEEFALNIQILEVLGTYEINTQDGIIPGLKFLCTPASTNQEAKLNSKEHSEVKWVTLGQLPAPKGAGL